MITDGLSLAGERLLELDVEVERLFKPLGRTLPVRALEPISKLGDQPALRLLAASLMAVGTFTARDRLVRAGARMLLAHECATVAKDLVKNEIDRIRPRSAGSRSERKPKKGNHRAKEKTSFPSGHSAGSIASARAFAREFPEYRLAATAGAGVLAAIQIVRCAHYPSDVAAGILIGLGAEEATAALWSLAEMDERSSEDSPAR